MTVRVLVVSENAAQLPTGDTVFDVAPRVGETVVLTGADGKRRFYRVVDAVHFTRQDGSIGYSVLVEPDRDNPPRKWVAPTDYTPLVSA